MEEPHLRQDLATKLTRREWLGVAVEGVAAAFFLSACSRPWARRDGISSDLFVLTLAPHPTEKRSSILYCGDLREKSLRTVPLPICDGHSLLPAPGRALYVIGKESARICRLPLQQGEADCVAETGDGFVTSGHAELVQRRGRDFLVTSEYRLADPSEGFLCFRDPATLRAVERHPSFGSFPHVVTAHAATDELMVENLGHRAGLESYSPSAEICCIDIPSLRLKRRIRPGREGTPYQFSAERSGAREADRLFRLTAAYELDARHALYPQKHMDSIAHTSLSCVSIWNHQTLQMVREIPLPLMPLGATGAVKAFRPSGGKEIDDIIVVGEKGAIQLSPPGYSPRPLSFLNELRSSQHLLLLPRT